MASNIPEFAHQYGFTLEGLGTHSSRTMMLEELRRLLSACPPSTTAQKYRDAVENANALLKNTQSTRQKSYRHLRELYALDPNVLLFATLRRLWTESEAAQPVLAMLCALARDPSLRSTAETILTLSPGNEVTSEMLAEVAARAYPDLSRATTLAKIGRNAASSWTQSGHVIGRYNKERVQAPLHSTSVTYALLLGHLCGVRGEGLFHTFWTRVLDHPATVLRDQAVLASKQGWLEYRHTGDVTEITFRLLLQDIDEDPAP